MNKLTQPEISEMLNAFDEIQMPRSKYILENMVVKERDTEGAGYAQCVLEMSIAWDNLRIADKRREISLLEIQDLLADGTPKSKLEADIKEIEIEQLDRSRLGARREFEFLYSLWRTFPKQYTREDLEADQPEYWHRRMIRQASTDKLALEGRISQSNIDGLRLININLLDANSTDLSPYTLTEVEKRYLEVGKSRILIAVPTEKQAVNGLPCMEGVTLPTTSEVKIFNVFGQPTAEAYNIAVRQALNDDADWLVTIEDDVFPPSDVIMKLLDHARNNPDTAWGAWYPKREHPRQGAHIIIGDSFAREHLLGDGKIHEVYTLAMGCTIYPVKIFMKTNQPWFATTKHLTQDSYFSQQARDAGYKLMVDTTIKCRHIDRISGEVYE